MDRRTFLRILGTLGATVATRDLWTPNRKFFLPPAGGWVAPTIIRVETDNLFEVCATNHSSSPGWIEIVRPGANDPILRLALGVGGFTRWSPVDGSIHGPVRLRVTGDLVACAVGSRAGKPVMVSTDYPYLKPLRIAA